MALQPITGTTGAETRARIDAAIAQVNTLTQYITDLSNRLDGVDQRGNSLQSQITANAGQVAVALQYIVDLSHRADGMDLRGNAFDTTINYINNSLNLRGNGQDKRIEENAAAIQAIADDLAAAGYADRLGDLQAGLDALAEALVAQRRRIAPPHRPGDVPDGFTLRPAPLALTGRTSDLPSLAPTLIQDGDNGLVARLTGEGVIGARGLCAIEPGRVYRLRAVYQRRGNAADPSGDAVQVGLVYLDRSFASLPAADGVEVVQQIDDLKVRDGRREVQMTFARSTGAGIALQSPARARYARAYVRGFGGDGVLDVEVLAIDDVTQATVLDPVSADVTARVGAIESNDLPARTAALEAQVGTPDGLTFVSRSAAQAATIPASIDTLVLLGTDFVNDGAGGQFKRVVSATPPPVGPDVFQASGATWARVQPLIGEVDNAAYAAWRAGLPKVPPTTPGQPWDNGGLVSYS